MVLLLLEGMLRFYCVSFVPVLSTDTEPCGGFRYLLFATTAKAVATAAIAAAAIAAYVHEKPPVDEADSFMGCCFAVVVMGIVDDGEGDGAVSCMLNDAFVVPLGLFVMRFFEEDAFSDVRTVVAFFCCTYISRLTVGVPAL